MYAEEKSVARNSQRTFRLRNTVRLTAMLLRTGSIVIRIEAELKKHRIQYALNAVRLSTRKTLMKECEETSVQDARIR